MTVERYIRIIAGLFIMVSLALGVEESPVFVSHWALAFTPLWVPICSNLVSPTFAPWRSSCANSVPKMALLAALPSDLKTQTGLLMYLSVL